MTIADTANTASDLVPGGVEAPLVLLAGLAKTYRTGKVAFEALRGVDLEITAGEMVAIVGPSGSGKTTLVNLVAGIDRPTAGTVTVNGSRLDLMGEEDLAVWRRANIGMVFQFFQLLPTLSALDNTLLPMELARRGSRQSRKVDAGGLLSAVGLEDRATQLPAELSGGEQQRVALARAMACRPRILIGDEPTGNLDTETARSMFALLRELNESGTTVIYVTHDLGLAALAGRLVTMRDGRIVADAAADRQAAATPTTTTPAVARPDPEDRP
jgi:putative ABC transport system ATP-binding protein